MTEQEYIDATNLARVRCAKRILNDTVPVRGDEQAFCEDAYGALSSWEAKLEKSVKTTT